MENNVAITARARKYLVVAAAVEKVLLLFMTIKILMMLGVTVHHMD